MAFSLVLVLRGVGGFQISFIFPLDSRKIPTGIFGKPACFGKGDHGMGETNKWRQQTYDWLASTGESVAEAAILDSPPAARTISLGPSLFNPSSDLCL